MPYSYQIQHKPRPTNRIWPLSIDDKIYFLAQLESPTFSLGLFNDHSKCIQIFHKLYGHTKAYCIYKRDDNSNVLIIVCLDGYLYFFDIDTGKLLHKWRQPPLNSINCCSYIQIEHKSILVTLNCDTSITLWDLHNFKELRKFKNEHCECMLYCHAYTACDGTPFIITGNIGNTIRVRNLKTGKYVAGSFVAPDDLVIFCQAFRQDGQDRIISFTRNKIVRIWDLHSAKEIYKKVLIEFPLRSNMIICKNKEQAQLVSVGERCTPIYWNLKTSKITRGHSLKRHVSKITTCCDYINAQGQQILLSASITGEIIAWDAQYGINLNIYIPNVVGVAIFCTTYQKDGQHIIVAGYDNGQWCRWNADNTCLLEGPEHFFGQRAVNYSFFTAFACETIVVAYDDGVVRFWDVVSGERLYSEIPRPVNDAEIFSCDSCIRNDGTVMLAIGYNFGIVTLWEVETKHRVSLPSIAYRNAAEVSICTFYEWEETTVLLTISSLGEVICWNMYTGDRLGEPFSTNKDDADSITCAKVHVENRNVILITGNTNGTIYCWDVNSGRCLSTPLSVADFPIAIRVLRSQFVIQLEDGDSIHIDYQKFPKLAMLAANVVRKHNLPLSSLPKPAKSTVAKKLVWQ